MSKTIKLEHDITKCGVCGKLIFDETIKPLENKK